MKFSRLTASFLALLLLTGCAGQGSAPASDPGADKSTRTVLAMDTIMDLTVYGPEGQTALDSGEETILSLEKRLSVTDEGIGISQEALPHIFDRFYRADESRTRQTGGSGLGLSIAKWIVERHGGWMEVVSRQNVGTRMTIVLPAVPMPEE